MAFKVQITGSAQRDIAEAAAFIHEYSPLTAQKWLLSLSVDVELLSEMPFRFALIPEASEIKRPLRSFLHRSHRVVYEVDESRQTVSILRVYHTSRAPLHPKDLE